MWSPCGCVRILGLAVAIGCGALGATRADGGFTRLQPPGPQHAAGSGHADADVARHGAPEVTYSPDSYRNSHATALDLPDAWDFRNGRRPEGDDHLVARLTSDRPGATPNYSQFWEDHSRGKMDRSIYDLGIDVKSSTPVVVPLPQGVWAGLIGLGFVIVHQVRRHRRQLA